MTSVMTMTLTTMSLSATMMKMPGTIVTEGSCEACCQRDDHPGTFPLIMCTIWCSDAWPGLMGPVANARDIKFHLRELSPKTGGQYTGMPVGDVVRSLSLGVRYHGPLLVSAWHPRLSPRQGDCTWDLEDSDDVEIAVNHMLSTITWARGLAKVQQALESCMRSMPGPMEGLPAREENISFIMNMWKIWPSCTILCHPMWPSTPPCNGKNTREEGLGWAHGQRNYAELCRLRVCKGMTSLCDLLVHFNICNVVLALQKQCDIYKEVKLDMLKDCPSLPSIGMRYGMCGSEGLFHTFGQEQADLAEIMNAAIINFPSCSSDTRRSATPPSGNWLWCWAASLMCPGRLWCKFAVPMGIGACHVRREPDYGLDAEAMYHNCGAWHSRASLQWLAYEAEVCRLEWLLHAGNGPKVWLDLCHLPVDGYHPDTTTVFQFHCCLFHCHDCREFEDT